MKITKKYLQELIKESMAAILNEGAVVRSEPLNNVEGWYLDVARKHAVAMGEAGLVIVHHIDLAREQAYASSAMDVEPAIEG